jgi:hypothetical protein
MAERREHRWQGALRMGGGHSNIWLSGSIFSLWLSVESTRGRAPFAWEVGTATFGDLGVNFYDG